MILIYSCRSYNLSSKYSKTSTSKRMSTICSPLSKEQQLEETNSQESDKMTIEEAGREETMTAEIPESAEDLSTTINRLQDETKTFLSKWLEELSPSEEFELLCPSRLDQLLQEAHSFEEQLQEQKKKIKGKLMTLNEIMKTPKLEVNQN